MAVDLTTNDLDTGMIWDLSLKSNRDNARDFIKKTKPILLIGSPMCTAFSAWQRLNEYKAKDPVKIRKAYV